MGENPPAMRRSGFDPWVGKIPWRRAWQPTPVFLPRECHGRRSLAGYSPWVTKSRTWLSNSAQHSTVSRTCRLLGGSATGGGSWRAAEQGWAGQVCCLPPIGADTLHVS